LKYFLPLLLITALRPAGVTWQAEPMLLASSVSSIFKVHRRFLSNVSDGVCAIEARLLFADFKLGHSRAFRAFDSNETKEYASRFERRILFGLAIGHANR
jgi:hypothetical protein